MDRIQSAARKQKIIAADCAKLEQSSRSSKDICASSTAFSVLAMTNAIARNVERFTNGVEMKADDARREPD